MLNNKGQSLVLFVLLLPILLLILLLVVDVGKMTLLRQELDDINYLAIDYALDKVNEGDINSNVKEFILMNKDDIDNIDILVDNNKIYVTLEDSINNTFSFMDDLKVFKVKSSYIGYIDNEKKIIKKDK